LKGEKERVFSVGDRVWVAASGGWDNSRYASVAVIRRLDTADTGAQYAELEWPGDIKGYTATSRLRHAARHTAR